jgi:hypothetical protein
MKGNQCLLDHPVTTCIVADADLKWRKAVNIKKPTYGESDGITILVEDWLEDEVRGALALMRIGVDRFDIELVAEAARRWDEIAQCDLSDLLESGEAAEGTEE